MTSVGETERGIGGSCHVVDSVRKEKERLTAVSTSKQRFGDSSSTIPTLTLNHQLEEGLGGGDEGSVCKVLERILLVTKKSGNRKKPIVDEIVIPAPASKPFIGLGAASLVIQC